jgi:hypothetical protein
MMSPEMIQQFLMKSTLAENNLSSRLFVPCLQKMSMVRSRQLRDIKFVGGNSENGNDIEFYEIIGPDKHRFYTGIQVKKGDLDLNKARELITQGEKAFEKDITDPSTGHSYRIGRWIIAATGKIKSTASAKISQHLARYGKNISFWGGYYLSEMLLDFYYEEFIKELEIDPQYALSQNVRINIYNPQDPLIIESNFNSIEWAKIDLDKVIPIESDTVYLAFIPVNTSASLDIGIKTSIDDVVVDAMISQVNLIPIKIAKGERACHIRLLQPEQTIRIICRGYRFIL